MGGACLNRQRRKAQMRASTQCFWVTSSASSPERPSLVPALYVLLNALYVRFYDTLGTRPEDVGLDRLAVLARAGWVAVVVLFLTGMILYALGVFGLMLHTPLGRAVRSR